MGILNPRAALLLLLAGACLSPAAGALETDQFYAWLRPMRDGTDPLNAWMREQIDAAVREANSRPPGRADTCEEISLRIRRRLYFFIFQEVELWATQTPLLDRVPQGLEDTREYRRSYLFANRNPFDLATWMPPSPTIEVQGVRFGTDKLSHFVSVGWLYHKRFLRATEEGATPERAAEAAVRFGIFSEKSIFGASSTGSLSVADLEANFQGMLFYAGICGGERPMLVREGDAWRVDRPFDIDDYVTPEWDESWNPPVYRPRRWKRVRKALLQYCDDLDRPAVRDRREAYRSRDRETLTERVLAELVAKGKLRDRSRFDIEAVCRSRRP